MLSAASLERLYDAHAAGLFHYFTSIVKCESDAKDLLQEFFSKLAVQALPANVASEKAFLYRSAHNQAIDWLRRHGTRRRVEEASAAASLRLFEPEADPDAAEFASRVEAALNELPSEQRTVAHLKLWEGLTFDQIAEAQGIPLNTAASRYRYAIDKLRTLLRPLYEEIQP